MTDLHELRGAPCWIELFTADVDAAITFYGGLFGWTATKADEDFGGYRMFMHGDRPVAGLMANDGAAGAPDAWTTYLCTDNAAEVADKVRSGVGNIIVEPMAVGDLGHMAIFADPAGATVGAWQSGTFSGVAVHDEPGSPGWFENISNDYRASISFYQDAFGWETSTMSDEPDFRYTTLGEGEAAVAGIMDGAAMLGDQPSYWHFYIRVDDTDSTVLAALSAGASQVHPGHDTPNGRLAVLTDPAGLQFSLIGPTTET
jgi:uncharacterized protein